MVDNRKSVLVVDEAESFIRFLEIVLRRLNYSIHHAASGSEALALSRLKYPDLVISEYRLSDGSGVDLCRALKGTPPGATAPFIFLSTESSEAARNEALAAGAHSFLTKPLNVRSLYQALEDHVEHRRRKYIRLPLNLMVKVRCGEDTQALQTQSFGEGGMFLKTYKPHPVGARLDLLVHLPEREPPLPVQGEVVHSILPPVRLGYPGMGVRFVEVAAPLRNLLSAFMEACLLGPDQVQAVPALRMQKAQA